MDLNTLSAVGGEGYGTFRRWSCGALLEEACHWDWALMFLLTSPLFLLPVCGQNNDQTDSYSCHHVFLAGAMPSLPRRTLYL